MNVSAPLGKAIGKMKRYTLGTAPVKGRQHKQDSH
jgi:hypothetical protein